MHLAVYYNHLAIVKLICEYIPVIDLVYAGKIPSSSGLANQSEISVVEYESNRFHNFRNEEHSHNLTEIHDNIHVRGSTRQTPAHFKVRSLILFWALDKGNNEILSFLWNYDKYKVTDWGVKNLEFMLLLANDLQDQSIFQILLTPKTFSLIMKNMTFS